MAPTNPLVLENMVLDLADKLAKARAHFGQKEEYLLTMSSKIVN